MSACDVIGLGALNWDLIYELADISILNDLDISVRLGDEIHLKEPMLPFLLKLLDRYGIKRSESGGGQAANTLYALARMGFKTRLLGKLGLDRRGDLILRGLQGIDTSAIIKEGNSGVCVSILTPGGERTMLAFPAVNDTLAFEELDLSSFSGSRFLYLTSFADTGPLKAQIEIVRKLTKGPLISLDPGSFYARLGLAMLEPILEKTYCLFATDTELEMMTGLNHQKAVKQILDLGVRMVVCKRGPKGAYLANSKGLWDFPPMDVKVRDVTGAGDCFAAGFLAGLLKGLNLGMCGQLGTKAAASCIQGYGRESYPDDTFMCSF